MSKPIAQIVFLALGSNVGNRQDNLSKAISWLQQHPALNVLAVSDFLETRAMVVLEQPDFLNCILKMKTNLSPTSLLKICQTCEKANGRTKTFDKGPRVIDVDILSYGFQEINLFHLKIPHPALWERPFLYEILSSMKETDHYQNLTQIYRKTS